jgi:hypothetical protein
VARVRPPRVDSRRARRKPVARGVANPPDPATQMLHVDPPTAAVFVDGSGRRSRRLRRTAFWLVALALIVVALVWLALGMEVFGIPAFN